MRAWYQLNPRKMICVPWFPVWLNALCHLPFHISSPYKEHQHIVAQPKSWWRHQIETFSALLALCSANSPVTGEFPTQRPVKRSFDIFSYLRLNKRLSKQSRGWWFETPSCPLWRHCNLASIPQATNSNLYPYVNICVCWLKFRWHLFPCM